MTITAEHHAADLRGADVAREIDSHALLFEACEILAEGSPVGSDVVVVVVGAIGLNDGIVQRGGRAAFASDFSGDALKDLRRQVRIHQDREFRLPEHVDEAGGDDFAGGVDGALARRGSEVADGGDFSVPDSEVAGVPRGAGAVDNVAVGDDEIEGRG